MRINRKANLARVRLLAGKTMASLKADVWKFFSRIKDNDNSKVRCDICKKEFAYHGTTSNMRDHLSRVHKDQYKRPTGSGSTQLSLHCVRKCSEARTAVIHQLLLDLVVLDIRPLSIVEGQGMKRLLSYLEPGYTPLSRKHLSKLLFKKYDVKLPLLKETLTSATGIAVTSDIWTSNSMESYMSITTHYISSKWEMESNILKTLHFPERHTGVNISDSIIEVVHSFNIDSKIVGVVHDTCANAELAGESLTVGRAYSVLHINYN